ncbi:hypothetical protein NHX12_012998 [Muraenolepis orangiensis]|uniref:Nuclear receptor coactivator 6 TRADD-N domain-containing protein n=1 Tax=Muraenolepis orangiensis TaxID=630683 RepID=A0A9Q0I4J6_9TELE|nr:hypothetical protein NHX12_012998 [Muraenolepis orangiensis]
MAHPHLPPQQPHGTKMMEGDNDSNGDSGVEEDVVEDADGCHGSGTEEDFIEQESSGDEEHFTIFVAFKGNLEDEDFAEKLERVVNGIPSIIDLGSEILQPQRVEPWNSVRVTFNIPRDAAERLRLLAQNNQQQLRDLGILSVQIEGEGPINVAMGQNRGPEVRVNGPIAMPGQMRMDMGFPGQPGPAMRMPNPSMVAPGPSMAGQVMVPGGSGQMHPRGPRSAAQTDGMDQMMSVQQLQHQQTGPHGSGLMPPQAVHHMQALQAGRQLNPAALQQLQQQQLQQHQQQQQAQLSQLGPRPPFNPSGQMAVPSNWNQLSSGVLQPPAAQGGPAWRKPPPQGQLGQRPPSLAAVQTPNHPPPPYPYGSQQAGQVFTAMGQGQLQQQQQGGMGQFAAPQPKGPQAVPGGVVGPPRPPPPLPPTPGQQGTLAAKSPGSSSSPFQQGSPGTPPMMAQRPTTPQGFPQGVGSPGRAALGQQGNMQPGFMGMPQHGQPGAQVHPGMQKRPMGFPNMPGNQNFVPGQVSATTPGTPAGVAGQQLQGSQALPQGSQPSAGAPNPMQGPPHAQPNVMVSPGGQPPGAAAGATMGQTQPGLQTQMMGLQHQAQPVSSSPSQMVQGQGGGQTVLSRPLSQGQRGGMTPPKQMMPQQGQGVMHGQGQVVGGPGVMHGQGQVVGGPGAMHGQGQVVGGPGAMHGQGQVGQQQGMMGTPQHMQVGNGHFQGHGLNFNPQFQGPMAGAAAGQPGGFPVNKDVTLTSPLLVNLLQSDISAGQFGPGGKQGSGGNNQAKPKKKKPPRKKKPKVGEQVDGLGGLDGASGLEDSDLPGMAGDHGLVMDTSGPKLPDFANRPTAFTGQPGEQRVLQQQQQMMMMQKMQQEQAKNRMSVPPGGQLPPRGMGNGGVPPSPDKPRVMPLGVNSQLAGGPRRMSHPDVGPASQGSETEEAPGGAHMMQGRPGGPELGMQPGNGAQQMMVNQVSTAHMMKQGPLPSSMPQHPGASPQQQLPSQAQQGGPMPGIHFPNVPTTSQSSRPKTPNRASPRPYHHPLTPTNRPPSTEPSEINLSPERLNASIAGLFPPKINIPLPPRQPNLNRGFDQQGLNPTTLKAIGQAPPNLNLQGSTNNGSGNNSNNGQQSFSSPSGAAGLGGKQDKQSGGQGKRASPSNSRRSSPASSRKTATPSPGRQKGTKMALACPPNQQQVNPQGQTVMLNHPSVAPNPVSMPLPVATSTEAHHAQNTFSAMQGNTAEGPKEGQGNMPQPQSVSHSQPFRDLSAPRMASPRVPMPHDSGLEPQAGSVERQPVNVTPTQDSAPEALPAPRDSLMSLNQLLDNPNAAAMPPRLSQSGPARDVGKESPRPLPAPERQQSSVSQSSDIPGHVVPTADQVETEVKPKSASSAPTSVAGVQTAVSATFNPNTNSTTVPGLNNNPTLSQAVHPAQSIVASPNIHGSTLIPNTNVTLAVASSRSTPPTAVCSVGSKPSPKPPVAKPPGVHSVIQIPASSSAISPSQITVFVTSNPLSSAPASQPPQGVVAGTMVVPNKNIRPQDVRQQTPRPPHFITTNPVFINPIFQVPGGLAAPNTTVVSQPVTVVGPIQVSANLQLSPAPGSSQPSGTNVSSSQPVKAAVGQVQSGTGGRPAARLGPPATSAPFQPHPVSLPGGSSPGTTTTIRKSPVSPTSPSLVKSKPPQAAAAAPCSLEPPQGARGLTRASSSVLSAAASPSVQPKPLQRSSSPRPRPSLARPETLRYGLSCQLWVLPRNLPKPLLQLKKSSQTKGEAVEGYGPFTVWGAVEKPKGPSRRSSRADKEAEDEPVADSGMRKRSARPAAAASAASKETGASPTQAKRRKSK